jgi:hypothetical protein
MTEMTTNYRFTARVGKMIVSPSFEGTTKVAAVDWFIDHMSKTTLRDWVLLGSVIEQVVLSVAPADTTEQMKPNEGIRISWGEATKLGLTLLTAKSWAHDWNEAPVIDPKDEDTTISIMVEGKPVELLALVKFACSGCEHVHADAILIEDGKIAKHGDGWSYAWCDECEGPVDLKVQ